MLTTVLGSSSLLDDEDPEDDEDEGDFERVAQRERVEGMMVVWR